MVLLKKVGGDSKLELMLVIFVYFVAHGTESAEPCAVSESDNSCGGSVPGSRVTRRTARCRTAAGYAATDTGGSAGSSSTTADTES